MSSITALIGANKASNAATDAAMLQTMVAGTQMAQNAKLTQDAINASAAEQDKSLAAQKSNFDLIQGQNAPYRGVGEAAIDPFKKMLAGGYTMEESPAAKYAMMQGTKQINNAMQSRGIEGGAVQRLGELGSGVAANDYQQRFNNLLSALNVGTSANAGTASATNSMNGAIQNGANSNVSSIMSGMGSNVSSNNAAAGAMGAAAGNMGAANAGYYSGLGGAASNAAALGLKAYQTFGGGAAASSPWTAANASNGALAAEQGMTSADLAASF